MEVIEECCSFLSHSNEFGERCQALQKLLGYNFKDIPIDNLGNVILRIVGNVVVPNNEYGEGNKTETKFSNCCEEGKLASEASLHLLSLVTPCNQIEKEDIFQVCIISVIKFCAIFQTWINTWSNQLVERKVEELLTEIISYKDFGNVEQLFNNSETFSTVLQNILPDLTSDHWKNNDQSRSTFIYLVKKSNGDVLTEHLGHIFPFLLILVDDYVNCHVVSGLICLQHILNEVPYSELRFLGRSEVIYDALIKKLYTREPVVANLLLPCLLSCLECIETKMMRMRGCELTKHDECFEIIMRNCHLSDDLALKRLYARHIPTLILQMGIQSISHMKTLLSVLQDCFDSMDQPVISSAIQIVSVLTNVAWIRIVAHMKTLLKLLVNTLYKLVNSNRMSEAMHERKKKNIDAIMTVFAELSLLDQPLVESTVKMLQRSTDLGLSDHANKIQKLMQYPSEN